MESFVRFVTTKNYEEFATEDLNKSKVLLFTNKKTTPALFKALSKDLKGKLIFG
jgi:DnaJ family protein C protein 16